MKSLLVIQLARMGDLLQSTPVLTELRKHYPRARICILLDNDLREVVENNPCVDRILGFRMRDLSMFITDPHLSLIEKYRLLAEELQDLKKETFDVVFNLNYTPLSILLANLLNAREIRGYRPVRRGQQVIKDRWMNYLFAATSNRRLNRFNLVDIFRHSVNASFGQKRVALSNKGFLQEAVRGDKYNFSGLVFRVKEKDREFARFFCEQHGVSNNEPVIGLQTGAGSRPRSWPGEYVAELARLLIRELKVKVILLGSASEAEIGREVEARARESDLNPKHLVNAIGKTTVGQLAALLERCDLLVTPDTGTMHLATAVGTKVLALFFASAYCYETGPYADGNVVLQVNLPCFPCLEDSPDCVDFRCRKIITPLTVFKVVSHWPLVSGYHSLTNELPREIDVFRSQTDDWGVKYVPLHRERLSAEEYVALRYQQMWKRLLGRNHSIELNNENSIPPADVHSAQLAQFTESMGRIQRLLERGKRITAPDLRDEEVSFELAEIERLLRQEKERTPWVGPVVDFYFQEKQNLKLEEDRGCAKLRGLFDDLSIGVKEIFGKLTAVVV